MDSFEAILLENTIKPITELSFHKIKHEFKSIPSDINKLKYLEVLNLGDITVDETSIVRLSFLKNLRELIIQNYQSHAFPIILIQCTKLKSLSLSHSQITSLPESLNLWHGLSYLNISYNKLLSEVNGMPPNLTYLHIGDTGLRTIPRNIYELENLRKLVANNLDFTKIPKEIFKIVSLRRLFLSDNKIKSISKEIIKLKELVELVLINNEFVTFPSNVTVLNKLYNLNLRDNYISSLPDDATNLLSLKIIDLSDNSLTEFPVPLLKLSLQSISLSNASYKRRIIKNRIKVIPEDIINNKSLHVLEIAGNPIENVPDEIVEGGLDAIKNFFQSKLEADNEDFLFEAKMVVVGRGNVGKSVLTKKLTNPNYELGKNDSTLGINVLKNPFYTKVTIGSSNIDFKLNIWDFGGQEKYDATHQLFITKRSIYLFLTEAREESNYLDFYYWLNTIQLFSDNSPVVIVLSKFDERKKSLPESSYKEKFDNIVEFVDTSCANGYEYTIDHLKNTLNTAIQLLPQTKLKLSNRWIDIRAELENLSTTKDYITYKEYLNICNKHKLDKIRADFLSQYLNDLGVIVHHQFDLLLKETVFINTDWCVDGMYKILDSDIVNNGKFTTSELDRLWDEPRFTDKKAELLKLMHQYHLCFELKDSSGFIVPELLPPDRKQDINWDQSLNLKFEYRYEFMPAGILSRFIIKSHSLIKDDIYWKHGVILFYEDTLALIEEDYIHNKIKVSLKGRDKRGLLSAIRLYMKEIHKDFDKASKLIFEEMIPCNCTECLNGVSPHFYKFNVLKRFEERGKKTIACDNSSYDVLIKSLIDDIQVPYKNWKFNTNQDLKDFIMDALENIIQKEIKFKSSYRNFWRDDNTPKNEPEIQPYISNTLDHYCKVNGIQLSREPREAEGNVDILFSTRNDENELIKVCLEIKKAHHQHIETSINTQLPMYMESSDTDAGIYLVIWLKNKRHPYPEKFNSIEDLEVAVLKNNPNQNKISVKILDCCKPTSPSKIRS